MELLILSLLLLILLVGILLLQPNTPGQEPTSSAPLGVLAGPREACVDSVCDSCRQYVNTGEYDRFVACKKECRETQKDAIRSCCLSSCKRGVAGDAVGDDCVSMCDTELVFGNSAPVPGLLPFGLF